MITEEVRQAVRQQAEALNDAQKFSVDDFMAGVEAKLSPKHPSEGAICELRFADEDEHWLAYSTGTHLEATKECHGDSWWDFDKVHCRVIPTAQDALDALESPDMEIHTGQFVAGFEHAEEQIHSLIDNAMEG